MVLPAALIFCALAGLFLTATGSTSLLPLFASGLVCFALFAAAKHFRKEAILLPAALCLGSACPLMLLQKIFPVLASPDSWQTLLISAMLWGGPVLMGSVATLRRLYQYMASQGGRPNTDCNNRQRRYFNSRPHKEADRSEDF